MNLPANPSKSLVKLNPNLFNARTQYPQESVPPPQSGHVAIAPGTERDLHDQIIAHCRDNGWYYVHSRMDQRTTIKVGCPDFIIALPHGKVLWIECKTKTGKLSEQQAGAIYALNALDHDVYVIRSMTEFLAVLEAVQASNIT